jgi:hypothetical protein
MKSYIVINGTQIFGLQYMVIDYAIHYIIMDLEILFTNLRFYSIILSVIQN